MSSIMSALYPDTPGMEGVEAFLRQLLKAQGIFEPKFSKEEIDQFMISLAEVFEEYVITALSASLNEQQTQQLANMSETATPQEQLNYLSQVVPDIQAKMSDILIGFSNTYLGFDQQKV